jgi:hypothetical protein
MHTTAYTPTADPRTPPASVRITDPSHISKSIFSGLAIVPADCIEPRVRAVPDDAFDDEILIIGRDVIYGSLARAEVMVWDERAPRLRSLPLVFVADEVPAQQVSGKPCDR